MNEIEELSRIVLKFINNPAYLATGAGKLAEAFKTTPDVVREAKAYIYSRYSFKGNVRDITKDTVLISNKARTRGTIQAKVLLLDIETAPILAAIWKLWKQSVATHQVMEDWFILSYAAKWLYSDKVISNVLSPEEAKSQDDSKLVKELRELLDEADVIITYNGINFDVPKINTRMLYYNLDIPSMYSHIDLLKTMRQQFKFSSNKLDYVNKSLSLDSKDSVDMQVWLDCYAGKEEALDELCRYNEKDVLILEDLYVRVRQWIKGHPNLTLFSEEIDKKCGVCGSRDLKPEGYSITAVGKYPVYRCNSCKSLLRGRKTVLSKEENKKLLKTN